MVFTVAGKSDFIHQLEIEKGLFYDRPETKIPPGGCSSVSNMVIQRGFLKQRPCFSKSSYPQVTATEKIFHLSRFITLTGIVKQICVTISTSNILHFYYYDTVTTAWVDFTGGINITASFDAIPQSVNFKSYWYFLSGANDGLYYWTGTGNLTLSRHYIGGSLDLTQSAPTYAKVLCASAERLFMMNHKETESVSSDTVPYRVSWSDWQLPAAWRGSSPSGSAGYQDLMDESDPIVAGAVVKYNVYAFKENYIYLGTPTNAPKYYVFRNVSSDLGCIAPDTIKQYKDYLLFLGSDRNVYMCSGQDFKPMSTTITERLEAVVDDTYVRRSKAIMDKQKQLYHLFVPATGSEELTHIFTLDLLTGAWTEGTITNTAILPASTQEYYAGAWNVTNQLGSKDGYIYTLDLSAVDDDGTAVTASWTSGMLDAMDLAQSGAYQYRVASIERALLDRILIEADSGVMSLSLTYGDFLNDMVTESLGTLDLTSGTGNFVSPRKVGRFFQLTITFTDDTDLPEISRIAYVLRQTGEEVR